MTERNSSLIYCKDRGKESNILKLLLKKQNEENKHTKINESREDNNQAVLKEKNESRMEHSISQEGESRKRSTPYKFYSETKKSKYECNNVPSEYQLEEKFGNRTNFAKYQTNQGNALHCLRKTLAEDEETIKNKIDILNEKGRQVLNKAERLNTLRKEWEHISRKQKDLNMLNYSAKLSTIQSIKALKFIPPEKLDNGHIFPRHYEAKLCDKTTRKLEYGWVQANFEKEALLSVQAIHDNDGFVMAPVDAHLQSEQYCMERYCRDSKIFTVRGLRAYNEKKEVSYDWMRTNFEERWITEVKRRSQSGKFVKIPPGNSKDMRKMKGFAHAKTSQNLIHNDTPVVKYQQGETKYCVLYSFASVLYYCGYTGVANTIAKQAKLISNNKNPLYKLTECLTRTKLK